MVTAARPAGAASQLEGRRVLVAMSGMPLGRRITEGLKRHGARVLEIRTALGNMVKAAARQWGALGMRLNWVGIAPAHYDPALAGAAVPQVPELGPPPPALHRRPEPQADVADVIAWLGSAGASAVTGASINLDGG